MKAVKIAVFLIIIAFITLQFPAGSHGGITPEDVEVKHGKTQEFGGGSYVEARYGDFTVGVVYGNSMNNNNIIIYSTGDNALREVERFEGGRLVKKELVSARTLIYERISRIIEFRDLNNNSRFDSLVDGNGSYLLTSRDYPVGGIDIRDSIGSAPEIERGSGNLSIRFKLIMLSPHENIRWNDIRGRMLEVNGAKIANSISINFVINISLRKENIEIPLFTMQNTEKNERSVQEYSEVMEVSTSCSLDIKGWRYRYPDSKLFVEFRTGMFVEDESANPSIWANMTSSSPRYLEINGSYPLELPRPIYGHSIRMFTEGRKIGEVRGDKIYLADGTNRSYVSLFCGSEKNITEFHGIAYRGFTMSRTDSYFQGNVSTGEHIYLKYYSVLPPQPVDGAPWWVNIMPFEVISVSMFAAFLRIRARRP